MDGHQFEHACASILRSKGFSGVKVTKPIYSVVALTILVIIIVIKSVIKGSAIKKKEYEETQLMILQKRQQIEEICQKAHQKKLIEENARIRNAELREQDKRDNREQYEELTNR